MMSKDLSVKSICDHYIKKEKQVLDSDKRTIRFVRDLNSNQKLKIYVNYQEVESSDYVVELDETSVYPLIRKKIILKHRVKDKKAIVQASYTTSVYNCVKCRSRKQHPDISFDYRKNLKWATDENKLLQSAEKIVMTTKNTNIFHPWYGSRFKSNLYSKIVDERLFVTGISTDVSRALKDLRELQEKQARIQKVTNGEYLTRVGQVSVYSMEVNENFEDYYVDIELFNNKQKFGMKLGLLRAYSAVDYLDLATYRRI